MRLNHDERYAYEPPPCSACGQPMHVEWIQVLDLSQDPADPAEPQWVPGTVACRAHERGDCVGHTATV